MKTTQDVLLIGVLCLPFCAVAQLEGSAVIGARSSESSRSSVIDTRTQASYGTSTTPSTPTATSIVVVTHSSAGDLQSASVDSTSGQTTTASGSMPIQQRDLFIILSSVLGSTAIILVALAVCLARRRRKGRAPFNRRGVTPIGDEEIESWRESKQTPAVDSQSPHTPRGLSIDSIALRHSPAGTWNWNTLPIQQPPPAMTYQPDFLARAPNSRVGLTDDAIPGDRPYIPVPRRQSSRLSKAPPGHERSKSRKSSMSARSTRSFTTGPLILEKPQPSMNIWNDPEGEFMTSRSRSRGDEDSPGTSIFDGLSIGGGGLSPRPKSKAHLRNWQANQEWEKETSVIGRAIA
ncbi:hypothetical protein BJ878DRAFT_503386 [Calycina marina]|uniref:Transmembrane protein n=1 Tax=Calycina marina TaxID=1763456 RepID=A0A9P8CFN3_9HELO|nr:hypothetical protein BJ878DRAFT_503386 [Calycina marina]